MENSQRQKDGEALPQIAMAPIENFRPPLVSGWPAVERSWFAVYTSSRHEKCVARHFDDREIEFLLPLYARVHQWAKRPNVRTELPLFPNYIFAHISPFQRVAVLEVPGVIAIVGRGNMPSALPDHEIECLRAGVETCRCKPHPYLAAGERVRIRYGSMAGMEGILVRQKNELRVVLTLDLIQRSVAVEIDVEDVEPIPMGSCAISSL